MQHLIDAAAEYYVFTMIGGCFILGMLVRAVTTIVATAAREHSRREIAAYIAEGSITPDQGERLMRADVRELANRAA